MTAELLKIKWRNRAPALAPCAMIAFERAATDLARKLLTFDDEKLQNLRGVSANKMILLVGDADKLSWTNGAVYLGRDAQMPSALLPTTIEPELPLDLFELVINRNFKKFAPCAVLPGKIISFGEARVLSREMIENWLTKNQ